MWPSWAQRTRSPPPTSTVRPGSVLLLPERPTACSAASSSAAPRPTDRPTPTPPENAMAPVGQEGVRRSSRAYTPAPFGPSHPKGRGRRRSTRAPDGARLAALGGPDRSQQEQQVKSGPPAAASADPALVPVRQASASSGCPPPSASRSPRRPHSPCAPPSRPPLERLLLRAAVRAPPYSGHRGREAPPSDRGGGYRPFLGIETAPCESAPRETRGHRRWGPGQCRATARDHHRGILPLGWGCWASRRTRIPPGHARTPPSPVTASLTSGRRLVCSSSAQPAPGGAMARRPRRDRCPRRAPLKLPSAWPAGARRTQRPPAGKGRFRAAATAVLVGVGRAALIPGCSPSARHRGRAARRGARRTCCCCCGRWDAGASGLWAAGESSSRLHSHSRRRACQQQRLGVSNSTRRWCHLIRPRLSGPEAAGSAPQLHRRDPPRRGGRRGRRSNLRVGTGRLLELLAAQV